MKACANAWINALIHEPPGAKVSSMSNPRCACVPRAHVRSHHDPPAPPHLRSAHTYQHTRENVDSVVSLLAWGRAAFSGAARAPGAAPAPFWRRSPLSSNAKGNAKAFVSVSFQAGSQAVAEIPMRRSAAMAHATGNAGRLWEVL